MTDDWAPEPDIDYDTPARLPDGRVEALERIDWHLRMVRRERARLTELEHTFTAEMDRIRSVYEDRQRVIQGRINWHTMPVESFHRAHPEERTITLPNGSSKLRVYTTPKVEFGGDLAFSDARDAVTEWARQTHPEILCAPTISGLRSVVKVLEHTDGGYSVVDAQTGELVPGVHAVLAPPSHSIDVEPGGWL